MTFKLTLDLHPKRVIGFAVLVFLAVWPWLPLAPFSVLGDAITAAEYSIVAVALVMLIGWVGQISIAHAALVGVGAYTTALTVNHLHIPFPANLPLAGGASGLTAALLGAVALRVRGLYLAVATLIFGYMADAFLFHQQWFTGFGGEAVITNTTIGHANAFPSFNFNDRRVFYYAAWACVLIVVYAAANLRSAKTGRAFFAVRGSEVAAASLGVNVTRYKLLAFVISGVFTGIAGNLIIVGQQAASADEFSLSRSIFFLSIAVVGGLSSLGGALVASIIFAGLDEAFLRIHALNGYLDITSALLLAVVLLAYPGGVGAVPDLVRAQRRRLATLGQRVREQLQLRAVLRQVAHESAGGPGGGAEITVPEATHTDVTATPEAAPQAPPLRPGILRLIGVRRRHVEVPDFSLPHLEVVGDDRRGSNSVPPIEADTSPAETSGAESQTVSLADFSKHRIDLGVDRSLRVPVIEAEDITVRFGGLVANDSVSFTVREQEIVGLIGPNGAGKTTLFNAVSGLNQPTAGSVRLFGRDVTSWRVHERARLGVGRTFQAIQLFGQLSVFDNLMVATHMQNHTGVVAHILATERSIRTDLQARQRVLQVLELLDLGSLAHRPVRGLPFGTLRMIEVARAMVTGARLIMLDEPASGLSNSETERLADVLRYLRAALGITLLVIEHDVPFVTSVSDYMYVLDRGRLLAEGSPAEIQRNEAVVAAYLGKAPEGDTVEIRAGGPVG